ncbi:MAG TPA: carboxypeptidase-like regulatory domain-containing protein [Planctomycetota bacterium]|nr:carboxypeptidase-like regulatory domain-containing protein [Planctomycetota bacterium]
MRESGTRQLVVPAALLLLLATAAPLGCRTEEVRRETTVQAAPPTTGWIRGTVLDARTDAPLNGATVRTHPPAGVLILHPSGHYAFGGMTPGRYTVTAAKDGYEPVSTQVSVAAGQTAAADIALAAIVKPEKKKLLYLKEGHPSTWTVKGGRLHQYEEIERWKSAGYDVTTRDMAETVITPELLGEYQVLNFNGSHYFSKRKITDEEGEVLYRWVLNGGRLFANVYGGSPVLLAKRFGVERIESDQRGNRPWPYYHGAPLTVGPVASDVFSVERLAAEQLDRVTLAPEHHLTVAARFDGYPAVVHGRFDGGKVVMVFLANWSHDATNPGNLYKATVFEHGNLEFIEQAIKYLNE